MLSNRGSSLVSTILAGAAALGVGVAGYYLVSGGCGSCSTDAAATATPVAAVEGDSCCPGDAGAEVVAVANEGEACAAACTDAKKAACATECSDEQKAACAAAGKDCASGEVMIEAVANETGEACDKVCTDAEKAACEGEKACDGEKAGEVMQVSNEGEKADCEKSCEGEAKVCPVTGQPIADAGS